MVITGMVSESKVILTKKGDKMAFVTLQDLSGSCEVIVFPELYKSAGKLVQKDTTIFIRGKINARDDIPKVMAEEIVSMEDVKSRFTRYISIDLKTIGLDSSMLKEIRTVLSQHRGKTPVYLSFKDPKGKTAVLHSGEQLRVETTDDLLETLETLVGENSVKIK